MSHVAICAGEQPKAQSNVGAFDGCGVGAIDGSTVGAPEGCAVGNPVGVLVGACVGGEIGHAASVMTAVREARLAYSAERKLSPFDCTTIFFARPLRYAAETPLPMPTGMMRSARPLRRLISLTRSIVVPPLALWQDVTSPGSPSVRKTTVTGALRGAPRPGHVAQRTGAEEAMGFEVIRKGNRERKQTCE